MATLDTVQAVMNTFALQWRFDFDADSPSWPALVALWEKRLRPFDDDVLSQVTDAALDELKKAPTIAEIRERCQVIAARSVTSRPGYLDELPVRDYVEVAAAKAFDLTIRQRHNEAIAAAAKGWAKLLDEVRDARKAGDDTRMAKAMAAVEEARSPAAYRRWQVYWVEKAEPGSSAMLPPLVQMCGTCQGQGYVLVPYRNVRGVPFHWTPVPKSPNAPGNSAGVLYYCPACVMPSIAEQGAAEDKRRQAVHTPPANSASQSKFEAA